MKKIVKMLLGIASLPLVQVSNAQVKIFPNDPKVVYTGRINFSNPLVPTFNHSGTTIKVKFVAKSISLIMKGNENTTFNLTIDNGNPSVLKLNSSDTLYPLASNLADGSHTVELVRRTETFFGTNEFLGFQMSQGGVVQDVIRSTRRIEFIGNSITCGYGIEAASANVGFSAETQNVSSSFAGVTAKILSAEQLTFCRSGIGMYRSGDTPGPSSDAMIKVYDRLNMYDVTPKWDFQKFIPQVVVIDLGTNDFNGAGADSTLFVQAYESFIKTVRSNYTNAKIFAVVGPMMGGDALARIKAYLQSMVQRFNVTDKNVFFFEISGQGSLGFGSDYHPSVAQGAMNAKELAAFIESKTDWKARPQVVSTKVSSDGMSVEILFDKAITNPIADTGNFKVWVKDIKTITIKNAVIKSADNKTIVLTLSSPIQRREAISLSYVEGSTKSADGEYLGSFLLAMQNRVVTEIEQQSENFRIIFSQQNGEEKKLTITGQKVAEAEVMIYNLQGVKVASLFKGSLGVGRNEIILGRNGSSLITGLYLIKIDLESEFFTQKIYLD